MLQPGVLANIKSCSANWCRVNGDGFDGWMEESNLWGAYPGESVDLRHPDVQAIGATHHAAHPC